MAFHGGAHSLSGSKLVVALDTSEDGALAIAKRKANREMEDGFIFRTNRRQLIMPECKKIGKIILKNQDITAFGNTPEECLADFQEQLNDLCHDEREDKNVPCRTGRCAEDSTADCVDLGIFIGSIEVARQKKGNYRIDFEGTVWCKCECKPGKPPRK